MLMVIQNGPAIDRRYRCRISCQPSVIQSSDFLRPSERSRIAATIRLSEKDFIAVPATRSGTTFCKEASCREAGRPRLSGETPPQRPRESGATIAAAKRQCNKAVPVDRRGNVRVTETMPRRVGEGRELNEERKAVTLG